MKYFLKHFVFKYFKNYTFNTTVQIKYLSPEKKNMQFKRF